MIVDELYHLATWIERYVAPSISSYEQVASTLEVNARQGQKMPLQQHLDNLQEVLLAMPVEELTKEQTDLLRSNDTLQYLGGDGWYTFQGFVMRGDYDPATSATEARNAVNKISNLISLFQTLKQSILNVGIVVDRPYDIVTGVVTRVHFKDKANIDDVSDLKDWSSEWYDIARGLSAAVGEKPQDVRVIGASTGSLIVILATSLLVAGVLSVLAKRANSIAKSVLDVQNSMEDLRHKKVLNQAIEEAMKAQAKAIADNGVDAAIADVKASIGHEISKEVDGQLKKAVQKYFTFTEKGGEIDMIAPPNAADNDDVAISDSIAELNASIQEVRMVKANMQKLLGNGGDTPGQ